MYSIANSRLLNANDFAGIISSQDHLIWILNSLNLGMFFESCLEEQKSRAGSPPLRINLIQLLTGSNGSNEYRYSIDSCCGVFQTPCI
ncbi:hypothetical protein MRB53_025257 [Persea americana]|uniref:Uncharacterized protein n=1 Tax=Persea americana TaxID=3435 RepID=A0ACC2LES1_PERAE|nr:hypothetical protein MRB53_025257 [Persea americana]